MATITNKATESVIKLSLEVKLFKKYQNSNTKINISLKSDEIETRCVLKLLHSKRKNRRHNLISKNGSISKNKIKSLKLICKIDLLSLL